MGSACTQKSIITQAHMQAPKRNHKQRICDFQHIQNSTEEEEEPKQQKLCAKITRIGGEHRPNFILEVTPSPQNSTQNTEIHLTEPSASKCDDASCPIIIDSFKEHSPTNIVIEAHNEIARQTTFCPDDAKKSIDAGCNKNKATSNQSQVLSKKEDNLFTRTVTPSFGTLLKEQGAKNSMASIKNASKFLQEKTGIMPLPLSQEKGVSSSTIVHPPIPKSKFASVSIVEIEGPLISDTIFFNFERKSVSEQMKNELEEMKEKKHKKVKKSSNCKTANHKVVVKKREDICLLAYTNTEGSIKEFSSYKSKGVYSDTRSENILHKDASFDIPTSK